jgi:glycosidase
MPWNPKKINLGFSENKTWLPVNLDYASKSVEKQKQNPDSMLNYTKELIKQRKKGFAT